MQHEDRISIRMETDGKKRIATFNGTELGRIS